MLVVGPVTIPVPEPANALEEVTVLDVAAIGTCPAVMPDNPELPPLIALFDCAVILPLASIVSEHECVASPQEPAETPVFGRPSSAICPFESVGNISAEK